MAQLPLDRSAVVPATAPWPWLWILEAPRPLFGSLCCCSSLGCLTISVWLPALRSITLVTNSLLRFFLIKKYKVVFLLDSDCYKKAVKVYVHTFQTINSVNICFWIILETSQLSANWWRPVTIRPLLSEQCTIILKCESQGQCSRSEMGKDEKALTLPLTLFLGARGHCLPPWFPHLLSGEKEREDGQMWAAGPGTARLLCSSASRPEWNRFISARKTACCGHQLSFYFLAPSSPQSIGVWGLGKYAKTYFLLWSAIFQRGTLINVQYSFYTRDT